MRCMDRGFKKKKRGLSPVVATVLLISIVIAIAVIVFLWFRGLTEEAVTKFEGENVETVCMNKVEFDAEYQNGRLSVSNTGNTPIFNFKLKVTGPGGHTEDDLDEVSGNWPEVGLKQGEKYSGQISDMVGSDTDSITLIPILIGNSEEGSRRKHTCEESAGYELTEL